jgi:tellurite resistance protein TerC
VDSIGTPALWIGFSVVVFAVLAVDLLLASKNDKPMSKTGALGWTAVWIACAVAFGAGIYFFIDHDRSKEAAMEFFTAYLIEYSLSVDNLFVFLLLFSSFKVPQEYQHRVLFWGIFGAVLLRAVFIFAGTALLQQFHFLIYLFGLFLVFTGVKLILPGGDDDDNVEDNKVVVYARKFIRVHDKYDGHNFFTIQNGIRLATPLFLVLVCVELSDVVFALDSIPAVFGVSLDPFIVYTSNIFAILGLRSLFFLLSGARWGLRFLKPALGVVLSFVGVKMCLGLVEAGLQRAGVDASFLPHVTGAHGPEVGIPTPVSLGVVGGLLALGIVASVLFPGKKPSEVEAAKEVRDDVNEAISGKHERASGDSGDSGDSEKKA